MEATLRHASARLSPALRLLWNVVAPKRGERARLTPAGYFLCVTAGGLSVAAYNNSSNILFLSLALTLAMLCLSGALSRLNFWRLDWRIEAPERMRVGETARAGVRVRNRRKFAPSYDLRFHFVFEPSGSTFRAVSCEPLNPGSEALCFCDFTPAVRGEARLRLDGALSTHPFAFFEKTHGEPVSLLVIVRPARVAHDFSPASGRRLRREGDRVKKGAGSDPAGLREYRRSDRLSLIHWKATARLGRPVVRETEEKADCGFSLRFDPGCFVSATPDSFEKACSFASTLAEELFFSGRLSSVALGEESPRPVSRVADLEDFLDRVSCACVMPSFVSASSFSAETLYFVPGEENFVHVRTREQFLGRA